MLSGEIAPKNIHYYYYYVTYSGFYDIILVLLFTYSIYLVLRVYILIIKLYVLFE